MKSVKPVQEMRKMMTLHRIRMGHRPQWRQKQKHCFTDEGEMRQKITECWKCDNNVSLRFYHHTLMPPTPSVNSPFNTNFIFSHFAKVTTTTRDVAIVLQGKGKMPYLDVWVVLEVDNDWSLRAACVQTPAHRLAS